MRPLISYDDLTDSKPSRTKDPTISPPKKRQKSNRNAHKRSGQGGGAMQAAVGLKSNNKTRYGLQEESRHLTHEDVWDDSALIAAWDAAAEEYEVLNGPEKSWKSEPVKKAPLSVVSSQAQQNGPDDTNIASMGMPLIPTSLASHFESSEEMEGQDEGNSRPLDFNTFVPQHDPSLSLNQDFGQIPFTQVIPPQASSSVSVDQACQNAMSAWYWAGYWTGIYHTASRQNARTKSNSSQGGHDNDVEKEPQNDDEVEAQSLESAVDQTDFIPT